MEKEKLRNLILRAEDGDIRNALWELYELKFCKSEPTVPIERQSPYINCINSEKSITTATL